MNGLMASKGGNSIEGNGSMVQLLRDGQGENPIGAGIEDYVAFFWSGGIWQPLYQEHGDVKILSL